MTTSLKSCCGEDSSLLAENEALRRRIMELEVLGGRRLSEFPDELRVLQSENNHFRDLTYSRLAEVEYWKRLYQTEKDSTQERLAALKEKYRIQFDQQVQRFKDLNSLDSRFNQGTASAFETQRFAWETESSAELAKFKNDLVQLERTYREQLAQAQQRGLNDGASRQKLQAEIDELKLKLANLDVLMAGKLEQFKLKIAEVTKEEIAKVLQRDYEYMQLMNSDLLSLQAAIKQKDDEIAHLNRTLGGVQLVPLYLPNLNQTPQFPSGAPAHQQPQQQQAQQGAGLHIPHELSAPLLQGQTTAAASGLPAGLDLRVLQALLGQTAN